jgi:hypothetical protein
MHDDNFDESYVIDSGSDGLAVAAYPSSSIQDHPRGGGAGDDSDEHNDDVLMTKKREEKKREKSSDIDLDSTRGADAVHIEVSFLGNAL